MPMGMTWYFSRSSAFKIDAAERSETSCSPDLPPKRSATVSFFIGSAQVDKKKPNQDRHSGKVLKSRDRWIPAFAGMTPDGDTFVRESSFRAPTESAPHPGRPSCSCDPAPDSLPPTPKTLADSCRQSSPWRDAPPDKTHRPSPVFPPLGRKPDRGSPYPTKLRDRRCAARQSELLPRRRCACRAHRYHAL